MAAEGRSEPGVAMVMEVLHYSPYSQATRNKTMGLTRVLNQMKTRTRSLSISKVSPFPQMNKILLLPVLLVVGYGKNHLNVGYPK
jgi:hypothetical protein